MHICNKEDIIYGLYNVKDKLLIVDGVIKHTKDILDIEEKCNEELSSEWFEECLGIGSEIATVIEEKIAKSGEDKNGFWINFKEFFDNWEDACIDKKISDIERLVSFDKERKREISDQHKEKIKNENKRKKEERTDKAIELFKLGKTKDEIASELGVHKRTIKRILGGEKNEYR